ncbi:hypothetical protein A3C32_02310 [Candidatus Daviesbacteria bacterium RIFCSPHIGHO2_02_FULL_41_14]|uniref:dTDP-4-dehydrorhamnose reductase n=1 Tax=Candidatus Daviesbacteria bacterium RIFCSPLOWO2_01_FULL_40_24 TaxID=1797787 RepID=A0A1F5MK93_9BACT|nr:MAG: hypothetical protein A3C32_02310 [Candidatus Daviesbacteria bacterium RIFCSPHIGHO2_02_FULL_41_14]OGE65791.1 MAG: hypothetical protein A3B49_01595 [Candidatus Daviesbacteria bacterium RIFCSPLOWO2_01_FULL_40_24]
MKILVFGAKGYIGSRCLEVWGDQAVGTDRKIYSIEEAVKEIKKYNPEVVLNAAGVRGKPNVDWCDKAENMGYTAFGNVVLPILLAEACHQTGTYMLHVGSGCVFYGESPDPKGWKEDDLANPSSHYSKCKYAADLALMMMEHIGIARIRVPMDDRPYAGNILDKLLSYPNVFDIQNSLTIIPDMIDIFYKIMNQKGQGIFHVTNPGAISYRRIIEYFQELIDPNLKKNLVTPNQALQMGLVSAMRSTNIMQSTRLESIGINMRPIEEAADQSIRQWVKIKQKQVGTV